MRRPITVLKFGSSVLARAGDLPRAADEIVRALGRGERVIAVVSAFGGTTESLLARAAGVARSPEPTALAALLATGERASAALLVITLEDRGVASSLADPERIALRVAGPHLDADPLDVDASALRALLDERPVAVVPGFFARGADRHVATLGRGGSDLTALFLAERLGARCLLVKDVDGVYDGDPRDTSRAAARFASLSYADALRLSARVVQPKALRFAEERSFPFVVGRSLSLAGGTTVWNGPTEYAKCPPNHLTNDRGAVN
jgi:homoserine dehydrogenase